MVMGQRLGGRDSARTGSQARWDHYGVTLSSAALLNWIIFSDNMHDDLPRVRNQEISSTLC